MAYSTMRHMVLSGGHPLTRWTRLPGPRGWVPLFWFITALICLPVWYSFLAGTLGTHCAQIFAIGDHYIWATVCAGLAIVLLSIGGYNFLEKAQLIILGLMLIGVFVAVFWIRPDWLSVVQGLFLPRPLEYPEWALNKLGETLRQRSPWVEIMLYAAAIGGQALDYLGYVSFLRDKNWGRSHLGTASSKELQAISAQPDHPARLWVRAAIIDSVTSFAMVLLIAVAFSILGAEILRTQQLVPNDTELVSHQAAFLTTLSPWLKPLYNLAVFLAFFGILYGGPEVAYRVFYEFFRSVPRWQDRTDFKPLRAVTIAWCLVGGVILLWLSKRYPGVQLIDIVTPAGIYTGVLSCSFYCFANPWIDKRFLPPPLRMPKSLAVLNGIAGTLFLAAGSKALWDYGKPSLPVFVTREWGIPGQLGAFLTFGAVLLASFVLAMALGRFYQEPTSEADLQSR